jgi:hypothetical protein
MTLGHPMSDCATRELCSLVLFLEQDTLETKASQTIESWDARSNSPPPKSAHHLPYWLGRHL